MVVQFILQFNFVFDIIIYLKNITFSESVILLPMKLLEIFIRVSLNNFTWKLISLPSKGMSQLKDLRARFTFSDQPFRKWRENLLLPYQDGPKTVYRKIGADV